MINTSKFLTCLCFLLLNGLLFGQASGDDWIDVGSPNFSVSVEDNSNCDIDTINDVMYAMAVEDAYTGYIYKFDGSTWVQATSTFSTNSNAAFVYDHFSEEVIVVACNPIYSLIYRFTGGSWEGMGGPIYLNEDIQLVVTTDGELYVGGMGSVGFRMYKWSGSEWEFVLGPALGYLDCSRMVSDGNGGIFVLLNEGSTPYSRLCQYDGSGWNYLGGKINPAEPTDGSVTKHAVATDGQGAVYVAICHASGTNVYSWGGTSWSMIASNIDDGARQSFDLVNGLNGDLYMAYRNVAGYTTCERWDGSAWSIVGSEDFTPQTMLVDLAVYSDGYPGAVFLGQATPRKLSAKRYMPDPSATGLAEIPALSELSITPTIASDFFWVKAVKSRAEQLKVFNSAGHLVFAGSTDEAINVSDWAGGTYIVRTDFGYGKIVVAR